MVKGNSGEISNAAPPGALSGKNKQSAMTTHSSSNDESVKFKSGRTEEGIRGEGREGKSKAMPEQNIPELLFSKSRTHLPNSTF